AARRARAQRELPAPLPEALRRPRGCGAHGHSCVRRRGPRGHVSGCGALVRRWQVIVAATRAALADALGSLRADGRALALVPTMGYLHDGHLSLVEIAWRHAGAVAASVFVNPLQFAPGEDFAAYPRDLERDLALLRDAGVDVAFAPSVEEMYPAGEPRVTVDPGAAGDRLCGAFRPDHFRGVLTVVAKLFGIIS